MTSRPLEFPTWLDQPGEKFSTEVLIPLTVKVGPVWSHQTKQGGWYGALILDIPLDLEPLWECDHTHPDRVEARRCGDRAAFQIVDEIVSRRGQKGEVSKGD